MMTLLGLKESHAQVAAQRVWVPMGALPSPVHGVTNSNTEPGSVRLSRLAVVVYQAEAPSPSLVLPQVVKVEQ